jgi:hypothetical protein
MRRQYRRFLREVRRLVARGHAFSSVAHVPGLRLPLRKVLGAAHSATSVRSKEIVSRHNAKHQQIGLDPMQRPHRRGIQRPDQRRQVSQGQEVDEAWRWFSIHGKRRVRRRSQGTTGRRQVCRTGRSQPTLSAAMIRRLQVAIRATPLSAANAPAPCGAGVSFSLTICMVSRRSPT